MMVVMLAGVLSTMRFAAFVAALAGATVVGLYLLETHGVVTRGPDDVVGVVVGVGVNVEGVPGGLPEDVAAAFVSLALARKTTGAVLTVDGGNIAAALR